ncbi:MAG TPA: rod shape-determining protein MreD [Vicinamibacterales bacterium]|nr:rod shape-determining protein MreD [Vicinamibacterales bacterium]
MKTAVVVAIVLGSVLLQALLARFAIGGRLAFDLVLVGVVFVALQSGPVAGMLAGTIGGVLLDLTAGGLVGIGGLLKTIVGFGAGVMGTRLVVAKPYARALIVAAATVLHGFLSMALQAAIDKWPGLDWAAMLSETGFNTLAAYIAFAAIEGVPGALSRGRGRQRTAFSRRQW